MMDYRAWIVTNMKPNIRKRESFLANVFQVRE